MSGPAATLYLPRELSKADLDRLAEVLASMSDTCIRNKMQFCFYARRTRPIGGSYNKGQIDACPFNLVAGPADAGCSGEDGSTSDFLARIVAAFGFRPTQFVHVYADCSGPVNHRILGELCLWLAKTFHGVVDFGGALLPPAGLPRLEADWSEVQASVHAMLDQFPGKLIERVYTTARGPTWAVHIADAEFMQAWLASPLFHMIK